MERRSCDDRLKPPPTTGQFSAAVDTVVLSASIKMHHLRARLAEPVRKRTTGCRRLNRKEKIVREESSTPVRALYDVPEAMALLNLSRTLIYKLIRTRRLVTVTQGRRRLVRLTRSWSTSSCSCGSQAVMMVARRSRGEGSLFWNEKRQRWIGIVSQGYAASGKVVRPG